MLIRIETRKKYAKVIDVDVKNSESSIHLEFWEENAFVLHLFPSGISIVLAISFSGSNCYALLRVFFITSYKNHIASGDNYILLAIQSHSFQHTLAPH